MASTDTPTPRLRAGSYYTAAELAMLARDALEASGETHASAAEKLGKKRPAISRAVNPDTASPSLCIAILEMFAGYTAEAPAYRLRKVEGVP